MECPLISSSRLELSLLMWFLSAAAAVNQQPDVVVNQSRPQLADLRQKEELT